LRQDADVTEPTPLPRGQFPVTEHLNYLNHAGVSPLPWVAVEAIESAARDFALRGSGAVQSGDEDQERLRRAGAELMGVDPGDVAFVKNTTEGLGFVANGLDWREGDRVLVPDHEFPSTLYPWLALGDRGVDVELLRPVGEGRELPLELFADALARHPVRLVAVSWVQFGRGWRVELGELATLCHDHGTLLCADVIQGLGVVPADLERWGVDFAMADAHKWMLGPVGIGLLYVARHRRDLLRPLEPGWASVSHREEWDNLDLVYDDSARRFEGGTPNTITQAGMGAAIDLLSEAGVAAVWRHVDGLCERLVDGLEAVGARVLTRRSAANRSGIVTFDPRGADPASVAEGLTAQGIVCAARAGGIRVAPHGYNTAAEIDALVTAVAAVRPA
jgi:selenocysteine lyase/cysteine desulfurase